MSDRKDGLPKSPSRFAQKDSPKEKLVPGYSGVKYEAFDDVPPVCACGGPWKRVPDGVRCVLCGKGQVVRQALQAAMRLHDVIERPIDPAWEAKRGPKRGARL